MPWSPPPTPIRAASATRTTSRCGRARRNGSRSRRSGPRRGARAPRVAHRVLGDVAALSRSRVRHPRGRARSALPASRERGRASTAAGGAFARYWVHNGLVTDDGQKMSKSLGNFTLAADVLAAHDPRSCVTPSRRPTTARISTCRTAPSPRHPARSSASRLSASARRDSPAAADGRADEPGRSPRPSRPRSTTTSGCRRRSPPCTRRCAPATAPSTRETPAAAIAAARAVTAMLGVLGWTPRHPPPRRERSTPRSTPRAGDDRAARPRPRRQGLGCRRPHPRCRRRRRITLEDTPAGTNWSIDV